MTTTTALINRYNHDFRESQVWNADENKKSENKALVEKYFTDQRKELGQVRKSSKAAYGYYQNMSKSNTAPPQFMDTKK